VNVFDTNREECQVPTLRTRRPNAGRHYRRWEKLDAFDVKTVVDFSRYTKVCLVEVVSPLPNVAKKQRVFYTIDGTTPTPSGIAAGKAHILTEESQNYFDKDLIKKAKFAVDTSYITERTTLVVTELTT
tara:strand:+ start:761 stop:1147 length:387 start_codon:yes stop_codon:yes gene_type:complete